MIGKKDCDDGPATQETGECDMGIVLQVPAITITGNLHKPAECCCGGGGESEKYPTIEIGYTRNNYQETLAAIAAEKATNPGLRVHQIYDAEGGVIVVYQDVCQSISCG